MKKVKLISPLEIADKQLVEAIRKAQQRGFWAFCLNCYTGYEEEYCPRCFEEKRCSRCKRTAKYHSVIETMQLGLIFYHCERHKVEGCRRGTPKPGTD